jgi:hypothetical protein
MRNFLGVLFLLTSLVLFGPGSYTGSVAAQTNQNLFDLLPRQARQQILEVRQWCKEAGTETTYIDSGLQPIDLNGDGSRDIIVDWKHVACGAAGGGGCSNRGCNLEIYKRVGKASWKQVFSEYVSQLFVSQTYKGKLLLLAISLVESNSKCRAAPTDPPSHERCDALIFWRKGTWQWRPIK